MREKVKVTLPTLHKKKLRKKEVPIWKNMHRRDLYTSFKDVTAKQLFESPPEKILEYFDMYSHLFNKYVGKEKIKDLMNLLGSETYILTMEKHTDAMHYILKRIIPNFEGKKIMNISEYYNQFLQENPDYEENPYFALLYVKMVLILSLIKTNIEDSLIEKTRTLFVDDSFQEEDVEELKKSESFSTQDRKILNNMTYMRKIQIDETSPSYDMLFLDFDGTITKNAYVGGVSRFEPEYIMFLQMTKTSNDYETKLLAGKNADGSREVEQFTEFLKNTSDVFSTY